MPKLFKKGHPKIGGMNKGDKHTSEARLKMSIAAKKRIITTEQREKMIAPLRGRKRPGLGAKLSAVTRGRPNPKLAGSKSHLWKGGITPINQAIRTSAKYKNWRTDVYKRDNYTCQMCGERGVKLEADHIKPFSEFPDLRFELSNGRTLCNPCHSTTDSYAHKQRWKLKGIVKP